MKKGSENHATSNHSRQKNYQIPITRNSNHSYYYGAGNIVPSPRSFAYQNPVKEKLVREINKRCEQKLKKARIKKLHTQVLKNKDRSRAAYDYYSSAWDKLISKTQNTNEDLKKGHYSRSKQRDRDEGSTGRTMNPSYYNIGEQPQTVKHSTSKTISFKPPLVPKITDCARRYSNVNQSSLHRTQVSDTVETPKSGKRMMFNKNKTQEIYSIGSHPGAMIKDRAKYAKKQSISSKLKDSRDFHSSVDALPCSQDTRRPDVADLLSYKSNFDKPRMHFKKPFQSTQSQMCHILGDVVKSAGLSTGRKPSDRRSASRERNSSQIVFGTDKDYMSLTDRQRGGILKETTNIGRVQHNERNQLTTFKAPDSHSSKAPRPRTTQSAFQSQIQLT